MQGPFLDFLYSPVASPVHPPQWNDPRFFLASDTDNLFDQTSKNNENVKFGAMHVVSENPLARQKVKMKLKF